MKTLGGLDRSLLIHYIYKKSLLCTILSCQQNKGQQTHRLIAPSLPPPPLSFSPSPFSSISLSVPTLSVEAKGIKNTDSMVRAITCVSG